MQPSDKKQKTKIGKLLSYILRHHPESVGLMLDDKGYVDALELIHCINEKKKVDFDFDMLCDIVETNNKQRYAFNEDKTKIRANQGHSVAVDVELKEKTPPDILYHGTATRFADAIEAEGLLPKGRLHVHLSADVETAQAVGRRHGTILVYAIDCRKMLADRHTFYLSKNGVWLVACVAPHYMERHDGDKGCES